MLNLHWCGVHLLIFVLFWVIYFTPFSEDRISSLLQCQTIISVQCNLSLCLWDFVWSVFGGSSNSWWNLWPVHSIISVSLNAAVFGFLIAANMPQMDAFIPSTQRPTQTGLLAFSALIWLLKFSFPTHILLVLLFLYSIAKLTWTFYFSFEKKTSHKWSAVTWITLTAVLKQKQEH